jgi:hypothetical protein
VLGTPTRGWDAKSLGFFSQDTILLRIHAWVAQKALLNCWLHHPATGPEGIAGILPVTEFFKFCIKHTDSFYSDIPLC